MNAYDTLANIHTDRLLKYCPPFMTAGDKIQIKY